MYKVIKHFTDLQDNGYRYNVGDTFPREGAKASEKRLADLASVNNRQKTPLIKEIEEGKAPVKETKAVEAVEKPKSKRGRKPATEKKEN